MANPIQASLIIPVYNEEAILSESLDTIFKYLDTFFSVNWEVIMVNDGSCDGSGRILNEFRETHPQVKVIHHRVNRNLGSAIQTGIKASTGDYVLTYDLDLSYNVFHIKRILDALIEDDADVVVPSPYMKGGKTTAVPFRRKLYSRMVNFIMALSSQTKLKTYTCMVRGYKGHFIRSLNLKAQDYEINPEIIYKAFILRAHIVEIPAHLDWSFQNTNKKRISGIRIHRAVMSGLMTSFIFRPYVFFITTGIVFFTVFLYMFSWIGYHTIQIYPTIENVSGYFDDRFSIAVSEVFSSKPHSFVISGILLIASFLFIGIGLISLQNKRYFDEVFNIQTTVLRELAELKPSEYKHPSSTDQKFDAIPEYEYSGIQNSRK